jgi:hypothetical protein
LTGRARVLLRHLERIPTEHGYELDPASFRDQKGLCHAESTGAFREITDPQQFQA